MSFNGNSRIGKNASNGHSSSTGAKDFTIIGKFATGFLLFTWETRTFLGDQHAIHERIRLEMLESYPESAGDGDLTLQDVEFLKKAALLCMDDFKTRACKGICAESTDKHW
jgi:DNA mismatch repair ATPase MutL